MIFDSLFVLAGSISAANAIVGQAANGAGNVLGTNTVDLGPPGINGIPMQVGDLGNGNDLYVNFSVLTAPTVGTSVQFQLIQADDAALSVNVQVINQTDAFAIAALPAGTQIPLGWDPAAPYLPKRYVGVRFVNVGAIATFSVFAGLVKDFQTIKNGMALHNGFGMI